MKHEHDIAIQRMLDELDGSTPATTDPDTQTYQKLYEALSYPPPSSLPSTFAFQVTNRWVRQQRRQQRRYVVAQAAAVVVALLLSTLALYYTNEALLNALVQRILWAKEIIVFVLLMIVSVQLIDRRLIRRTR